MLNYQRSRWSVLKKFDNNKFDDLNIDFTDKSIKIPYPQIKIVDMYLFQKRISE